MKITEQMKKNLLEFDFKKPTPVTNRCRYGWVRPNGEVVASTNEACHAAMSYPYGYGNNTNREVAATYNVVYGDANPIFHDWITNPNVSPYKSCVEDNFLMFTDKHGSTVMVVGDVEKNSSQLITSFFKASRIFTEGTRYGTVFNYLVEHDVHPTVAFFICQVYYSTDNKGTSPINRATGWHGSVTNNDSMSILKAMVAQKPNDNKTPYVKSFGYYGCDAIWGGTAPFLCTMVEQELKTEYNTRWSGKVYHDDHGTLGRLVSIGKELMKQYGLGKYDRQQAA